MKKRLKIATIIALLVLVGITACMAFDPHMAWFWIIPRAKLTVDGKQEIGWVHRSKDGRALFVTHGVGNQKESYSLVFPESRRGIISKCAHWTASHFSVFPIGDLNPPCWDIVIDDGTTPKSVPPIPERNFVSGDNFLEFTLNDGRRLKATW